MLRTAPLPALVCLELGAPKAHVSQEPGDTIGSGQDHRPQHAKSVFQVDGINAEGPRNLWTEPRML
jgi:hypothetical protein